MVNSITTNKLMYQWNESITIDWDYPEPQVGDWIGIYPNKLVSLQAFIMWVYVGTFTNSLPTSPGNKQGSWAFAHPSNWGNDWPIQSGSYRVHLFRNGLDNALYDSIASSNFTVMG
jgi:hypothetical protein